MILFAFWNGQADGTTIVLQDDFSDGDHEGWTTVLGTWDASFGYMEAVGLEYVVELPYAYTYTGNPTWRDYTFEIDITFGTGNREYYVAVRVDPTSSLTPDRGRQYLLSVDGHASAIRLRCITESQFYDTVEVPHTLLEGETYHLQITIVENTLEALIDGEFLFNYTFSGSDPIYESGCIGIGYKSQEGPDGAYFDNVVVTSAGCDFDVDGYESEECGGTDCDDMDPAVHPGAEEICDYKDNDCDGTIPADETPDEDGDGWLICAGDCDDTDPAIYPGAEEICGAGIDFDCDGMIDEDFDLDLDGYTTCDVPVSDCDDTDPIAYPGAPEICDGKDTDCDGILPEDEEDGDEDGWFSCEDCDDEDSQVNPGHPEVPDNGIDDDCDGKIDELFLQVPADQPTIQDGIDAALTGDIVLVAPGTYMENINFLGKAITVRSEAGADVTVIDGGDCTAGEDACSVVTFSNEAPESTVLDGFIIQHGTGNDYPGGGGILIKQRGEPLIMNCTITGNKAGRGGGLSIHHDSSPIVTDCTISGNHAARGGGIMMQSSKPLIMNCTITGNSAYLGGGIAAEYSGYAMYGTFINCIISANIANAGGGILVIGNDATFKNCIITANTAAQGGGIFSSMNADPNIENSIFWGNSAHEGPEIYLHGWTWGHSHISLSYSDVQGGPAAAYLGLGCTIPWQVSDGNIDVDPLFVGGDDFRLRTGSPCIDSGMDAGVYEDIVGVTRPQGAGFDMGAYEYVDGAYWALETSGSYMGGSGSVSLDITLGTLEPATWACYLILTSPTAELIPLWAVPLPVTPVIDLPITFPFPSIGTVGFYNGLYSATDLEAYDLEWVDTGS